MILHLAPFALALLFATMTVWPASAAPIRPALAEDSEATLVDNRRHRHHGHPNRHWGHRPHHGHFRPWHHHGHYPPRYYAPPPPRYYAPPPYYYPPRYYAPPPGFYFEFRN
jgi:hypothetical protein